jgi:calcium-dependent protein kinase
MNLDVFCTLQVVQHCHNMNVIHRDLKPENFLLTDKTEAANIKATDFGLSVFFKDSQAFRDIVGSAYYVAPEVCMPQCLYQIACSCTILQCRVQPAW